MALITLKTNLFFPLVALSLLYLILSKLTTSKKKTTTSTWPKPIAHRRQHLITREVSIHISLANLAQGRRFCTGQPLASRVVPHIIASLVYHFEWTLRGNMDPTRIDMSDKFDVTMLKKEPLCVIPKLRRPFIN